MSTSFFHLCGVPVDVHSDVVNQSTSYLAVACGNTSWLGRGNRKRIGHGVGKFCGAPCSSTFGGALGTHFV